MANLKHMNNDMAVSPIVATLVLIVVAVIGAVAVGTIMGTFSSDVSKQANTGDIGTASATEIIVAGSTTVQPASEYLAKEFMKANPSIKINVQGGGSGAGVSSAGMGIVDIGASSELTKITDAIATGKEEYKDLKTYQVGGSAVVFIAKSNLVNLNFTDVNTAYLNADTDGKVAVTVGNLTLGSQLYQRQESSGTEEAVAKALAGFKDAKSLDASTAKQVQGNQGMVDAVKGSTNGIGFADYGVANGVTGIYVLSANGDSAAPSSTSIKASLKAMTVSDTPTQTTLMYNIKLSRGLYYITKGEPNSVVKSFITYAQSPSGAAQFNKAGMFGVGDFAL